MLNRIKNMSFWLCTALAPMLCAAGGGLASCSEEDEEVTEYENWQQRNDQYFATLQDSLRQNPDQWLRLKSYSLDETTEGQPSDYVYAKVMERGQGTDSPMFTDSVRVSYQGRLIPSASYPEGYVFDSGTTFGTYSSATNATSKWVLTASGYEYVVSGWITALLHMHRGDYWRIYIPYDLGYKDTDNGAIPAYSTLIFDLTLVDFSPAGQVMPPYSARRK